MCYICGQPNYVRCNCTSAQPFCDQCNPNTNCTSITDSQCVIYHFASPGYIPPPTKLINLNMPNGSSAEAIFEKIDTMFGAGFFRPWITGDTNTLHLHLDGPGLPVVLRGDVKLSSSGGNELQSYDDGLFVSFNPDYKVKVDAGAPPRYLADSMVGGTDGCVSITVNDIGGLINIQPFLDIQCFTDRICDSSGTTKAQLGACLLNSSLSVLDTPSIDLTLTPILNGLQLSANSKISSDIGNIIVIKSDGLFASGGTQVTANNGLNISSPGNVQLGGTLLQSTLINAQTFSLSITGANVLQLATDNGFAAVGTTLTLGGGGTVTNANDNINGFTGNIKFSQTSDQALLPDQQHVYCGVFGHVIGDTNNNITNGIPSGGYFGAAFRNAGNYSDIAGIRVCGVNGGLGATYTGTITNYYGIRIEDINASLFASTITNRYAIYQSGTTDRIQFNGIVTATNASNNINTSDKRVKENIIPLNRGLKEIEQINTYEFNYIYDDKQKTSGVIAQELAEIMPEAVKQMYMKTPDNKEYDDLYMIQEHKLFYAMLNAIKELSVKVKALESK